MPHWTRDERMGKRGIREKKIRCDTLAGRMRQSTPTADLAAPMWFQLRKRGPWGPGRREVMGNRNVRRALG